VPTYQYACTACDERLEVVQKFTDDPMTECPACTGQLRKVFSAVGIVFKGSGFYRTDNRPAGKDGQGQGQEGKGRKESKTPDAGGSSAGKSDASAKPPSKSGPASKAEAAA
jgi:putative FmdB family regulatory protein